MVVTTIEMLVVVMVVTIMVKMVVKEMVMVTDPEVKCSWWCWDDGGNYRDGGGVGGYHHGDGGGDGYGDGDIT